VQKFRALLGKEQSLRRRIIAVDSRPVHIAFGEADYLASFEVNGGKNDQWHWR
jgi:hypothetical protein